ncbi:MAG TPA: hypothetical protein VD713_02300 [Sphingomonadales bacterium]|nr:hypothetical protein [Sphingomonadales bacterium]
MARILFILIAVFHLASCAGARREWPSVSFSGELKAFELEAAAEGAVVAPLPTLNEAERAGIDTPDLYWATLATDFSDLKRRLGERLDALRAAEAAFAASEGAADDLKLGAELELSNLSLTVEELPAIRARAALLDKASPDSPEPERLAAEAKTLEAAFRALLLEAHLPTQLRGAS